MAPTNTKHPSRTAKYRNKVKEEDPEKYQLYLEAQRQRCKQSRDNIKRDLSKRNPDEFAIQKKENQLRLQRVRQKRYTENKQQNLANNDTVIKITFQKLKSAVRTQTRHKVSSKREYNKIMKRKQRAKMTPQKKMWEKKKDRERKVLIRLQSKKGSSLPMKRGQVYSSKKTEWNVTSKVRATLPKSPQKFAAVLHNIVEHSTPRKRKALEDLNISSKKALVDLPVKSLKSSSKGKSALKEIAKHLVNKSHRFLAQKLQLNRRTIARQSRSLLAKRKSKVDETGIKDFYKREDVSRVLPQKRYATKDGPGYLLQVSIKVVHAKYLAENPNKYVSFGKFASLRPKNVRKLSSNHRQYCCCIYCVNIRYKLLSLCQAAVVKANKKSNECDLPDILLCPKNDNEKFHQPACIEGKCEHCSNYTDTLRKLYTDIPDAKLITWSRWEKMIEGDGKIRRVIVTKTGTKDALLEEFVDEDIIKPAQGTTFLQHLHTAHWQQLQFANIRNTMPDGWALQIMDFAKNREVKYQDEIKSAFYSHNYITLHPIVTYYRTSHGIARESSIIISEDHTHDYHAVHHFQNVVESHIEGQIGKVPLRKVIFSDGCSAQYKSKGPFADIALGNSEIDRNFYGSEHGKGDCDADIGVINRAVDRAIIGGNVIINCARDMYDYCNAHLTLNENLVKRHFFFVTNEDINRHRPETNVRTLVGSRKIHQCRNVMNEPYALETRNLSCFCLKCREGSPEMCLNKKYVHAFEQRNLMPTEKNVDRTSPSIDFASTTESIIPPLWDTHDTMTNDIDVTNDLLGDVNITDLICTEELAAVYESLTTPAHPRYNVGTYLKISHGSHMIPAVVVDAPSPYEEDTSVIWIQFLKKWKNRTFTMEDKPFVVVYDDVLQKLDPPDIVCCGTRILYVFNDV